MSLRPEKWQRNAANSPQIGAGNSVTWSGPVVHEMIDFNFDKSHTLGITNASRGFAPFLKNAKLAWTRWMICFCLNTYCICAYLCMCVHDMTSIRLMRYEDVYKMYNYIWHQSPLTASMTAIIHTHFLRRKRLNSPSLGSFRSAKTLLYCVCCIGDDAWEFVVWV